MKTEFKREMNRNYMVLHPEKEIGGSYALRMLSENRINGLLPFQEKRIDGETFLYFNITSRQSLARMMEYRSFKANDGIGKVPDGRRPALSGTGYDLCGSG